MSPIFIASLSLLFYGSLIWFLWRSRSGYSFLRSWPAHPTLFRIWLLWLLLLALLTPLTYHEGDMSVWRESVVSLLQGRHLPAGYVYLPIYAQLLAAISWPFYMMLPETVLPISLGVNWFVLAAYVLSALLMVYILPDKSQLGPLALVLAPVTVFYVLWGTNHVVMLFFLLLALVLVKKEAWFWAGVALGFACYKFLLVPTAVVLLVGIFWRYRWRAAVVCMGGVLLTAVPSLVYYATDQAALWRILSNQGAIGAHSHHVEAFHFFYAFSQGSVGFEAWYIGQKMWFVLALLGIPLSLLLYWRHKLNFVQALAVSYAFVAIFAPEPFRLEPLIGLLWLDAVYRSDLRMQTAVFGILFVHAITWFDKANSRFLVLDPLFPTAIWQARGVFLGVAVMLACLLLLFCSNKEDFLFADESLGFEDGR